MNQRARVWYAKYIGYSFNDEGKEVILRDVFYWEDETGKSKCTGYELYYPESGRTVFTDISEMRRIARQTKTPRRPVQ